jgi:hypothetical protein
MTPDPAGLAAADPTNPESRNRYAYVMNSPTALTDPSGLCAQGSPGCPPPKGCTNMVCADNPGTFGGSIFSGYQGPSTGPTCSLDGVEGYCSSVLDDLQNGSAALCPSSGCDGLRFVQGPAENTHASAGVSILAALIETTEVMAAAQCGGPGP